VLCNGNLLLKLCIGDAIGFIIGLLWIFGATGC